MPLHQPPWLLTLTARLPPQMRLLPLPAVAIIALLILINLLIWAAVAVVLHYHSSLASTALLAYTLGLRHALDADHISAIDLMTRRLIATGQRPVTVGTWFSLGHSTIVVVTCECFFGWGCFFDMDLSIVDLWIFVFFWKRRKKKRKGIECLQNLLLFVGL